MCDFLVQFSSESCAVLFKDCPTDLYYCFEDSRSEHVERVLEIHRNHEYLGAFSCRAKLTPRILGIQCTCFIWRSHDRQRGQIELWLAQRMVGLWSTREQLPFEWACPSCPGYGQQSVEDRIALMDGLGREFPAYRETWEALRGAAVPNRRTMAWIGVVFAVIVPTLLLLYDPTLYNNPLVAFLLSLLIAGLSVIASRAELHGEVRRRTQTEWLSQAESACDRLLTTAAQVQRLAKIQSASCAETARLLPELDTDSLRPVRCLLATDCKHTSMQLKSISEHLESAVQDWERFIRKNCESDDCRIIGEALMRRRADLAREGSNSRQIPCEVEGVNDASHTSSR